MNVKTLYAIAICLVQTLGINAQKALYIPNEWKNPWSPDTLLYKEVDTDNKYTWSKSRSKESDNFIVYWDKYYTTAPNKLSSSNYYYVNIDDLLKKAESFYALNVGKLTFCDEATSKVSKYKTMILINHTDTWTCYGGGYDFTVPALWLNPATCKPVGHSVAHEVGHSFQYMCYSDVGGHAGFHDAIGNGSTFWEQTAQWQANQSYPELIWSQSWNIFQHTANYAMTHEWMRYQSYWWHYYLTEKYGIDFIGKIWRHPMSKAADANEVLMDMMGYGTEGLFKDYFEYALKMATLDLDATRNEANNYIGTYTYNCIPLGGTKYQVAYSSCPQSTGFNVIPLSVPAAGTEITVDFTSLKKTTSLASDDPVQYYNGDSKYVKLENKKFYNSYSNSSYNTQRGFRLGYVALLADGTRKYIYEDKLYCATDAEGKNSAANLTESVKAVIPEGTKKLYLVVVPAPRTYIQHKWDEDISNDDQWPYTIELSNTNISGAPIISDDREICDAEIIYDVYFAKSSNTYPAIDITIDDEAAATLGTAFQMLPNTISGKMAAWTSSGPKDGQIMFYAVNADGNVSNTKSSANGYGHWFTSTGNRCEYSSGYLYSEFNPSSLTFTLGQYPGKLTNGKDYSIRQALKYKKGTKTALVKFTFNIHVQTSKTGSELTSTTLDDSISDAIFNVTPSSQNDGTIYTLDGRQLNSSETIRKGVYISNGKKYIK